MNYHNMTQKSLFESYMSPAPMMSRCFSSKANVFAPHLPGNSLYSANGYLGNMRHFNKNAHFGPGHLKMPPLEHRSEFCDPLVKIVGGFVGSKSQAGTTNHRGRELYLWDIIVDKIMETMENQEAKHEQRKMVDPGKRNGRIHKIESITMIGVGHYESESGSNNYHYKDWHRPYKSEVKRSNGDFPMMQNIVSESLNSWRLPNDKTERINDNPTVEPCPDTLKVHDSTSRASLNSSPQTPLEKRHSSPISICATKSPISVTSDNSFCSSPPKHILRPEAAEFTPRIPRRTRLSTESESEDSLPTDSISSSCESRHSSDTSLQPKIQRTLSECSVDSDDSFIVFESAEDDPMIVSEDSDDEDSGSDEDLDEIDNLILIPHNVEFSQPQAVPSRLEEANRKWAESYCGVHSEDSVKKVRFAEGKDLVKVKHLVAWNFAHRAARVGPWEMYHRDSERFKSRINALSAVLSPVLAKHHREKIYTERFQT